MKTIVILLSILYFETVSSQVVVDSIQNKVENELKYFVCDDCADLSDRWENNKCTNNKIAELIADEFNWDLITKSNPKHKLWVKFLFNNNGEISKFFIETSNEQVKSEAEKIVKPFLNNYRLVDADNNPISGHHGFPCYLEIHN